MNKLKETQKIFFHLTVNEFIKYFNKTTTFLFIILIVFSVFLSGLYLNNSIDTSPRDNTWKSELSNEIDNITLKLNKEGAFYSDAQKENMNSKLEIDQYRIEHNIQPYHDKSASNFILYVNNIFIIIFILSMIFSTKIITDEYNGTIKSLISTGIKRWKILLSKIIVIFIVPFIFMLIMLIMAIIIGWILFGFDNFTSPYLSYINGKIIQTNVLNRSIIQIIYNSISISVGSTFAVFLGILFKNGYISSLSSVLVAIFGTRIAILFQNYHWIKYSLFANIDFYKYYNNTVIISGINPQFSLIVLGVYFFFFLLFSFIIFNTQDIKL